MFIDRVKPNMATGLFKLTTYDRNNNILEKYEDNNLIVTQAKTIMRDLLQSGTDPIINLGIGTSEVIPNITDTSLVNMQVVPITAKIALGDFEVKFEAAIDYDEHNGMAIAEYGLLTQSERLFARKTRTPIVKDNTLRIELEWIVRFT